MDFFDQFQRIDTKKKYTYTEDIEDINNLLKELEPNMQPELGGSMTESTFVNHGYLEMFYNITKYKGNKEELDKVLANPLFQKWMFATKGMREVAIVDDNDNNVVLYKVPPFHSNKVIDNDKLDLVAPYLDNVALRFEQDNNYIPGEGLKFIKFLLVNFQNAATAPDNETKQRWVDIFKRYVRPDGSIRKIGETQEEVEKPKVETGSKWKANDVPEDEWE